MITVCTSSSLSPTTKNRWERVVIVSFAPPFIRAYFYEVRFAFSPHASQSARAEGRAKDLSTLPFFCRLGPRELIRRGRGRETCHPVHGIHSKMEKHDRSISHLVGTLLFSRTRIIEESISHPFFLSSALADSPRAGPAMGWRSRFCFRAKARCI